MSRVERLFHSVLFEVLAVILSVSALVIFTDHSVSSLSGTMIVIATIAMGWNFVFNLFFDRVFTGAKEQRSIRLRVFHVVLFEGGLLLLTVPILAYTLGVSMWQAFVMDIGVTIFITLYAFVFNYVYDHVRAKLLNTSKATLQAAEKST